MEDRELLELAAKAASVQCDERGPYTEHLCMQSEFGKGNWLELCRRDWNPLTDDGDALRLAVDCRLFESFDFCQMLSAAQSDDDAHYSTRRAIVRAAAELGSRSNAALSGCRSRDG